MKRKWEGGRQGDIWGPKPRPRAVGESDAGDDDDGEILMEGRGINAVGAWTGAGRGARWDLGGYAVLESLTRNRYPRG